MSDSDIQPGPEVPGGLVERTIDACHKEAPFEVAKYAEPTKKNHLELKDR